MLADLTDMIVQLGNTRPKKVEIRVDRFETLTDAIYRSGVILVGSKPSERIEGETFMGVPVLADEKMPYGFAAIIADGEVVNILDLRAKEDSA